MGDPTTAPVVGLMRSTWFEPYAATHMYVPSAYRSQMLLPFMEILRVTVAGEPIGAPSAIAMGAVATTIATAAITRARRLKREVGVCPKSFIRRKTYQPDVKLKWSPR